MTIFKKLLKRKLLSYLSIFIYLHGYAVLQAVNSKTKRVWWRSFPSLFIAKKIAASQIFLIIYWTTTIKISWLFLFNNPTKTKIEYILARLLSAIEAVWIDRPDTFWQFKGPSHGFHWTKVEQNVDGCHLDAALSLEIWIWKYFRWLWFEKPQLSLSFWTCVPKCWFRLVQNDFRSDGSFSLLCVLHPYDVTQGEQKTKQHKEPMLHYYALEFVFQIGYSLRIFVSIKGYQNSTRTSWESS